MAFLGQTPSGNASVKVNGLGPTTHIVSVPDMEAAVTGVTTMAGGASVAGIDMDTLHVAVQTTAAVANIEAAANGSVVATFTDNYPR